MKILAAVCVCVVTFHLASAQTETCLPGSDVKNGNCTPCPRGTFQSYSIPITDTVTRCKDRTKCDGRNGQYMIEEGSATEDNSCWCNESLGYRPRNPENCKDPENRTFASCVCISVTTAVPPTSSPSPVSSVTTAVPRISSPSPVSSGLVAIVIIVPIVTVILVVPCIVCVCVKRVRQRFKEFCAPICGRCCQCCSSSSSSEGRITTFATWGLSSETQDATDSGVRGGRASYNRQPSAVELLYGEANGDISHLFLIKLRELCLDKHTKSHFFDILIDVGANWKFLVRPDLEEIDIQALEHDHRGLKEIVYQAIRQWYEKVSGKNVQFVLDRLEMEKVGKGDLADQIRKDGVLRRKLEEIYVGKSSKIGSRTVTANGSRATGQNDASVYYKHDDKSIASAPPPDENPSSRPSRAAGDVIEYENSPRPGYKSSHPSINEVKIGEEGQGDGIVSS